MAKANSKKILGKGLTIFHGVDLVIGIVAILDGLLDIEHGLVDALERLRIENDGGGTLMVLIWVFLTLERMFCSLIFW